MAGNERLKPSVFGDAVYELWVRTHLMELGYEKVKDLHKQAISYVRASTQARLLRALLLELDEVEQQIVLRGRNAKGGILRTSMS